MSAFPEHLLTGYQTRLAAAALAAFSIVASFAGHYGQGDGAMAFWHTQMLLKDIAVAGGLIEAGQFRFGVDQRIADRPDGFGDRVEQG